MGKHQKSIGIILINQSDEIKWIPQGQHIGTVHLVEGRTLSEDEAQEIIHQLRVHPQDLDELNTGDTDDFITSNNQVQLKRPVQHPEKQKLSAEMKRKLDAVIDKYLDIFSKGQYDIRQSTHPPWKYPLRDHPAYLHPTQSHLSSDPGQIIPSTNY